MPTRLASQNTSSVEPYREVVKQMVAAEVEVAAIYQRLIERGLRGPYSAVHRFVGRSSRASLEEARRSVLDLRAAPLEGRSLARALEGHIAALPRLNGVRIKFTASGARTPLPARVETGIYRIAQEALSNVIAHSNAAQASVDLVIRPEELHLTVRDDGRGFDPDGIPPGRYGLLGMNERARLLGGSLHIHSAPGAGTSVKVRVPL